MKKPFKLEDGTVVDLITHIKEVLADKTKNISLICVGTDSQNKRYNTTYVTTVCFHYSGRGAHCVYTRENVKKIKDKWQRLWGEVYRSIEIAELLTENKIKVDFVELDFNQDVTAGSNDMAKAAGGYVVGLGYKCKIKPEENLGAIKYSDYVCRS